MSTVFRYFLDKSGYFLNKGGSFIGKKQKNTVTNPYTGHIHTAQIDLYEHEVPNLREIDAQAVPGCVKNDSYRGQGASIRSLKFNPNEIALVHKGSPMNRWPQPIGDCNALADFEVSIHYWAEKTKVPEKYAHIVRLDFAFDYYGTKEADIAEQIRILRAIVFAFTIRHRVTANNEVESYAPHADLWKSHKALKGVWSIVAYDRRIDHPESPVTLRLEIRYGERLCNRSSRSETLSVPEILHQLEDELRSLLPLLQRVEKARNDKLIEKYSNCGEDVLEFVRANADRIFTRRQLRELIFALDDSKKTKGDADDSAGYQLKKYPFIFHTIKPKQYTEAVNACLEALKKYEVQSGFFEKQIKIAESSNPVADGLVERFTY